MIVSGIDRYIATWFDVMKSTKRATSVLVYTGMDCVGGVFAIYYHVDFVSVSDRTVMVKFVTDSIITPSSVGSIQFTGEYGQPIMCINMNQLDGIKMAENIPLSGYQFVAVFHT